LLDCKEEDCKEVAKDAPQILDYLDEDCRLHFKRVLEFLDEAKIPYILNPHLVRGLDYYTKTIFEILPEENITAQSALPAGGRYDRLIDIMGGTKTPAAGWATGIERIILALKEKNVNVPEFKPKPKVFLVQLGDAAKRRSLNLFESFRKAGIEAKSSLGRDSIKSQLRIAHRLGVKFTLIFGQKEALDGTIILREMDTGVQETIPMEKIVDEVKKRLKS
jgi:histidyl-tRNA synthetase